MAVMINIVLYVRVRFALTLVDFLNFRLLLFRCIIHVARGERYVIIAVSDECEVLHVQVSYALERKAMECCAKFISSLLIKFVKTKKSRVMRITICELIYRFQSIIDSRGR